jgi:hypothetical protein
MSYMGYIKVSVETAELRCFGWETKQGKKKKKKTSQKTQQIDKSKHQSEHARVGCGAQCPELPSLLIMEPFELALPVSEEHEAKVRHNRSKIHGALGRQHDGRHQNRKEKKKKQGSLSMGDGARRPGLIIFLLLLCELIKAFDPNTPILKN